jgi:hypothetical protein
MLRLSTALTAAVLALALAAPLAAAATNPYGPVRVCGSSYRVIGSHAVTGPAGGVLGVAYLTYSRTTRKNCAVMIKRRAIGVPTFSEVSLAAKGGNYMADNGDFRYFAGPLYVHAPGRCVIYGGRMRDAKGNGGSWITPRFGHCG